MSSPHIVDKGTAIPYLAIFDGSGNPVIDEVYQVPIGMWITNFSYKYLNDDCDEGEFTLETNNPNISDHPSLAYLMPLKLQWGWRTPSGKIISSPVRSVVVKDHNIKWGTNGISFTLLFSDSSFLLKSVPATYKDLDVDLTNHFKNLLKGNIGLKILDYSNSEKVSAYEKREFKVNPK